ncbi:MAG TPA: GNAT family N-acetyltransferase [Polyangiaceae bacterium]|nr:GNAT family N-acetyltransferase [Polyangiaceae bacterium]
MADPITIRPALPADCAAINDIYNHYVLHDTCTYQLEPETLEARFAWLEQHDGKHPVLVAEQRGELLAWGSLSAFHSRVGYRFSVEDSVYVRHDRQHRGLGKALLAELLAAAQSHGHHTVIALISADKSNSIALHQSFGFTPVGLLRQVGYKFETWLDVAYLQLML